MKEHSKKYATITIQKQDYEIWLVRQGSECLPTNKDGSDNDGLCDNVNQKIYLNRSLSKERLQKVLCHELLHMLFHQANIRLPERVEERYADAMEVALLELLQQSAKLLPPQLVK